MALPADMNGGGGALQEEARGGRGWALTGRDHKTYACRRFDTLPYLRSSSSRICVRASTLPETLPL